MLRSMAGLMGVTAFLSMWINNTAAASIMLPVALAITSELESHSKGYHEMKNITKESTSAVNGKLMILKRKIIFISCTEVLDLTEIELSDGRLTEEVILNALHIEEPYI